MLSLFLFSFIIILAYSEKYELIQQRMTFDKAQEFCKKKGSNLASIEEPEDFDILTEITQNANNLHVTFVWIGLKREKKDGEYNENWFYVDTTPFDINPFIDPKAFNGNTYWADS